MLKYIRKHLCFFGLRAGYEKILRIKLLPPGLEIEGDVKKYKKLDDGNNL